VTGQITLVAALVRAGATYYSDEFAVLDGRGRVHAFAAPLSLRRADGRPERLALGDGGARAPLPVAAIVFGRYRAGARFRTRGLSAGEGALELLRHTPPARQRPRESLAAIQRALAGARCVRLTRGEADAAAAELLRGLDADVDADAATARPPATRAA
jgi:hypothetical protein